MVSVVVILAIGSAAWAVLHDDVIDCESIRTGIGRENPLGSGKLASVEIATRDFQTPIYRPSSELASDETIEKVWMDDSQVYIEYESGASIDVERARPDFTIGDLAAGQMSDGVPGQRVEVGGVLAFAVPATAQECFGGSVTFDIGDAHVSLIGDDDYSFDELLAAAATIVDRAEEVETAWRSS